MESGFDWSLVEDASPANRELGAIARRLAGLHESDASLNWGEARQRRSEVLQQIWSECDKSQQLAERLKGRRFEVGGSEHSLIELPEVAGRIFKITGDDSFGTYWQLIPSDPDLTGKHFHAYVCEDPVYYLYRMMLLNGFSAAEYQTEYEGILPPDENLVVPRICVSQGYVPGDNPARDVIASGLNALNFQKISEDTFLNFELQVLIGDAAPRNVRVKDGILVLFDAIAEVASDQVIAWALEKGFSP